MKKLFLLLLTVVLVSCDDENNIDQTQATISAEFSSEKFVGNKVAYKVNEVIKLGVSNKQLLNSFNNYSEKLELGKKALSLQMEEINGKNYIRFHNEDMSVSTVALINTTKNGSQNNNQIMSIGVTVCTSVACANCCGCIPDGSYCSLCNLSVPDCKRTTSDGPPEGSF